MLRFAPVLCLIPSLAFAQQTVNYASLGGRVTDPSGAVIENAEVTARQLDTDIATSQRTNAEGRFLFPFLRVGAYEIAVAKDGFQTGHRRAVLTVGAAFDLSFPLAVGPSSTTVEVAADAPLIENARTQIASTLSLNEVRDLPLSGRNYFDIALYAPGVSPTNTASNQLFAETSAMPGQGLSVSSQRNFSNSYIVDGVSANDDAAGVAGAFIALDVVQEFQVVTSGGQAEFGRALGGYMNVVTKSGGNRLHGDVYGYFRNSRFNAANPLSNRVLPLTQAQYGASLSGPIRASRAFYFANFEGRALNQSGLTTISAANVAAINARLDAVGYRGPRVSTGIYRNPVHSQNAFAKADYRFSERDQFSARYSLYHVASYNSRGAGALSAPTASANLFDTDQTLAVNNVFTISPHVVNETRGQFTNSSLSAPPSDPIGPAVSISGVATFGALSGSPTGRSNRLYEVSDSVSIQHGANSFKAGAAFLYNDDDIAYPRSYRGSYAFSSLANFLNGVYNNSGFTQTFGVSTVHQTNPNVGFYAQNEYRLSDRLTVNAGVRYDLEWLRTIDTQKDKISPRAGFAWSPLRGRRMVIRGGFGLFYDRIPLRPLANALLSAGNTAQVANLRQIGVSLSPSQAGAPVFPAILSSLSIPSGVFFNFSLMTPDMRSAYAQQGSFEIEQQIGASGSLTVGYQHLRGLHLIASINRNVPTCTAAGTNNGCRPDMTAGNVSQYTPAADSHYDGAYVQFLQRPLKWGNYRVSYTYSKALDDVGEFFFSSPMNNYNIWQDYSRADDDQRSRLAFEGTVHTPVEGASGAMGAIARGWRLTSSFTGYSSLPFNIATGSNTVQGTGARPTVGGVYIGRNLGRGFAQLNLAFRLSRTFAIGDRIRVDALAEMFNALNHVNVVTLNGVFGTGVYPTAPSAAFRQVTAVNDPRGGQFGLRFRF